MDHIFIDCAFGMEVTGGEHVISQLFMLEEQLRTSVLKIISLDSRLPKFEPCISVTFHHEVHSNVCI
jgi:hypothetical protein